MDKTALLEAMLQIVEGVRHIHAAGYIHRDLKPDNTLVGADGLVKLCDFGCAAPISSTAHLHRKCETLFSPAMTTQSGRAPTHGLSCQAVRTAVYHLVCETPHVDQLLRSFCMFCPLTMCFSADYPAVQGHTAIHVTLDSGRQDGPGAA